MIRNLLTATVVFCAGPLLAQDAGLAKDFYLHGLKSRALETFIEVLHSPKATPADRAEALYYMGQISFDENSYSTALDDWQSLIKQYPTAARSIELKDRLTQLKEVFATETTTDRPTGTLTTGLGEIVQSDAAFGIGHSVALREKHGSTRSSTLEVGRLRSTGPLLRLD
jgi:hypothetical protein